MKNFNEYSLINLKKWFSFYGRASRIDFLLPIIFINIIQVAFVLAVMLNDMEDEVINYLSSPIYAAIFFIVVIILLLIYISLAVRRLHDIDYNSWIAISLFIPIVNLVISAILLFKKGTYGNNKYGYDPLGVSIEK